MTINMKDLDVVLEEEFGKTEIEEFHNNFDRGFYNPDGFDFTDYMCWRFPYTSCGTAEIYRTNLTK